MAIFGFIRNLTISQINNKNYVFISHEANFIILTFTANFWFLTAIVLLTEYKTIFFVSAYHEVKSPIHK